MRTSAGSLKPLLWLAALLWLTACGSEHITSCEPFGAVTPICGVKAPEDIEPLPENGGLIVAEYGDDGKHTGDLLWYQPGSNEGFVTLVSNNEVAPGAGDVIWGETDCPVPRQLSPHGIHLSRRDDSLQLLVVNHASPDAVLMYEVRTSTEPGQPPVLDWRGCVSFPGEASLNDVAALPGGGFAVTHMYPRQNQIIGLIKVSLGLTEGHVWLWSPEQGLRVLPNSGAKIPNGIQAAADGQSLWVNHSADNGLRQYGLPGGEILQTVPVPNLDNSSWLPDGRLLVASFDSMLGLAGCFGATEGSCGAPYSLVAVDPANGDTETLFHSSDGEPFGPATIAVAYRGKLYAGSFTGDRMAVIDIDLD